MGSSVFPVKWILIKLKEKQVVSLNSSYKFIKLFFFKKNYVQLNVVKNKLCCWIGIVSIEPKTNLVTWHNNVLSFNCVLLSYYIIYLLNLILKVGSCSCAHFTGAEEERKNKVLKQDVAQYDGK